MLANNIYTDAERLHSLVENILALTRLHEGKLVPEKQLEVVEEVVGAAIKAMANRLADRSVVVNIPTEILLVPMDAKLIEQVLINLLDNAVKHTQPDEEICISVVENETEMQAEFHIADRGKGIPPTDLPYIFQMFFTSQSDKKERRRGIGLGLSICESIVVAHGGTIKACNRTDGPGAELIFTLPLQIDLPNEGEKTNIG
jgi:two-component system sensor histidine kinase KdpD